MPEVLIESIVEIKQAAAQTNAELNILDDVRAKAILAAGDKILDRSVDFAQQFPVGIFQTGSGTSTNMNVNEVLATLASEIAGSQIHPNDHVNKSQSSNDVIPSAIHISATKQLHNELLPSLKLLATTIEEKAASVGHVTKTGRTHLMDAVPITLAQELSTWSAQIHNGIDRINAVQKRLKNLPLGGTAVGTGLNAPPDFSSLVTKKISARTKLVFQPNPVLFEGIASQDTAVELSGQLKTVAVSMIKICNDLRWMNSGPTSGLGEITLQKLQPGSSIMPGKVNPVIPEAVAMACTQIIGHDAAITLAGQSGNFQLNVMLPLIAYNLLSSIALLTNSSRSLADNAIASFSINKANIEQMAVRNPIVATVLNVDIGYELAAKIVNEAISSHRPVIDVALEMTDLDRETLESRLDPIIMTQGGILN